MKDEMNAFDILAMTSELQAIVGGYVDKIFHWDKRNVLLRVNSPDGRKEVLLKDLKWLYIAPGKPDIPDIPSEFAVNLRKHLSNLRVVKVSQREFDRIVLIDLERAEAKYQLIIELFSGGNLILVSEGKILNSIISRKWRHREVRPGVEYAFPQTKFNPRNMDYGSFSQTVAASSSDAVRTLATEINIGGQYAEEACLRAGIMKNTKAAELTEENIRILYDQIELMFSEAQNSISAREIIINEELEDVSPIPLKQHEGFETVQYENFSTAIHHYVQNIRNDEPQEDKEVSRLKRLYTRQKEAIDAQLAVAEDYSKQAEAIYSQYSDVDAFLKKFSQIVEGKTWDEIRETVKPHSVISEIDPKNHTMKVTVAERQVLLDYTLSIEGNANMLYLLSKDARAKAKGAQDALADTEKKLAKRVKETEKDASNSKTAAVKTKEYWFERYKWFITSNGHLVIAGRDAHSNDKLVKKHLKATEKFAHADIHGAPSTVIVNGAEAGEEEMEEVCAFALSHSKAWMTGAQEGTAYWVLPDQVSKMPQSGEFVPRGAFVIRGKRNYIYHLPLELAVGEIEYEGSRKIMCGPVKSVSSKSSRYVVIVPGKTDAGKISSKLSKAFAVPEEEISRILPPGKIEIGSIHGIELEE